MTEAWESYTAPEDDYTSWTRSLFEEHKSEVFTWSGKVSVYKYEEWLETNESFLIEQWKQVDNS